MKTEVIKSFVHTTKFVDKIMYDNISLKHTNIFHDIVNYVRELGGIENLEDMYKSIREIEESSKSKCRVDYSNGRLEAFKPNKYIFPEILIEKL